MSSMRLLFRAFCAIIIVLAAVEIAWVHHARSADEPKDEKPVEMTPKSEAMPQELENKRVALEDRARALDEKETRLKERERDLDLKIKEMERLREVVSGELENQKKNNEERVNKLVAVFETMTPKSASNVFETLDDWLAVEVLKKMDVKRVAKIMNIMEKTRSAKLSEMLTGYYRPEADRKVSSSKPAAGQAAAIDQKQGQAVAQAPKAPAPQPPQNSEKKGGEK